MRYLPIPPQQYSKRQTRGEEVETCLDEGLEPTYYLVFLVFYFVLEAFGPLRISLIGPRILVRYPSFLVVDILIKFPPNYHSARLPCAPCLF